VNECILQGQVDPSKRSSRVKLSVAEPALDGLLRQRPGPEVFSNRDVYESRFSYHNGQSRAGIEAAFSSINPSSFVGVA
jgi:hypothetical protein